MNVSPSLPQTLPRSVTNVADGKIFALGPSIETSRCHAWIAPNVPGWMPFQCYVLRDGGELIMLDGGFPVMRTPYTRASPRWCQARASGAS